MDIYYARFHTHAITAAILGLKQILTKPMEQGLYVEDSSRSWCMPQENLKDNHYARFNTNSYHCCREMHNNSRLDVKF